MDDPTRRLICPTGDHVLTVVRVLLNRGEPFWVEPSPTIDGVWYVDFRAGNVAAVMEAFSGQGVDVQF